MEPSAFVRTAAPAGMMVFGVLRANGTMELANTQPTLHVDDKILFAELAD